LLAGTILFALTAQNDCSNQGMRRQRSKRRRGEDFLWRG
jgi:hypothetical protein